MFVRVFWSIVFSLFLVFSASAQFSNPFDVSASLVGNQIVVEVGIPAEHYLYAKDFKVVDANDIEQKSVELPAGEQIDDPVEGGKKMVFSESFKAIYAWMPSSGGDRCFTVNYSGCNHETCFLPQSERVVVGDGSKKILEAEAADNDGLVGVNVSWMEPLRSFSIAGQTTGFMPKDDFLDFLAKSDGVEHVAKEQGIKLFLRDPEAFLVESGLFLTILFILLGGLALNLTPCVLPMIPINLAIIGAGAQAGSKGRGFALGAAYGAGIALTYGVLGAVVVLTGTRFGAIQTTGWFNLLIAIVFLVLSLAMFDLFHIDFSRFQSKIGGGANKKQGSFLVAVSMGGVAALLAGACVAPVVIAVLLLAARVGTAGLLLPFVLGVGMALPWPFAGSGLSFLPKPGRWMEVVKYVFGVGILLMAIYYGLLAYQAFRPAAVKHVVGDEAHLVVDGATNEGLADALRLALAEEKPLFLDFWAHTCKNCLAMDKTTFKDEAVRQALDEYVLVKYVADQMDEESVVAVLDHFQVQGLPTFIILKAVEQ